jgi:hypothetical protein
MITPVGKTLTHPHSAQPMITWSITSRPTKRTPMTMTPNCPSTMMMDLDADREEGDAAQGAAGDGAVDVAAEETKEVAAADVIVEDSPRTPTNRCTTKWMEAVMMMTTRYS